VLATPTEPAVPVAQQQQSASKIIIKSSGAASRQPQKPRVLRQLLAERQGGLQIAKGYGSVGLTVTEIVQGTLDDPDYPKRPIGTNHLEVLLLDEAAFATGEEMTGFEGTWSLSRTSTGALYVSSIKDTPWPASRVATRQQTIDNARAGLRSNSPDDRVAALAVLDKHPFLELVPDVIALLDDQRSNTAKPRPPPRGGGPVVVRERALELLHHLVRPFADERTPRQGDRVAWERFWQQLLAPEPVRRVHPTERATIATIPMNQSWPGLVAVDDGFVFAIGRMEKPFDGHTEGIAISKAPFTTRTWIAPKPGEGMGVVRGSDGSTAVLVAADDDTWQLHIVSPTNVVKTVDLPLGTVATHAAIAPAATGYVIAYLTGEKDQLFAFAVDPAGKLRGAVRPIALPGRSSGSYHRGVFPLQLARKPGGFLATLETSQGVIVMALDDKLAPGPSHQLPPVEAGIPQPSLGVSGDRAMIAWTNDHRAFAAKLGWVITDLAGKPVAPIAMTGFDVQAVSKPIALDGGGWAVAWVESGEEVHLGRWNAKGELVGSAIIEPRGAIHFALTIARQGKDLLVGYQDVARYPFTLVARRVDPAKL
jgi:hypothetical protein